MTTHEEALAGYYYRNMSIKNLVKMQAKGPNWKQLRDYKVSHSEWYQAVDQAIRRHLDEIQY